MVYWLIDMMRKDIKVIIVHGNGGGTADIHWFPYLKKELEKLGVKAVAETFPDNDLARANIWLPFLKNNLGADENTVIVGHSSGAVAAMRFAEKNKIFGSILVGVCYTDLGEEEEKKSGYYDRPWDWQAIRSNQNWIIQYHSTDDPHIPIAEARFIHQKLKTEYYEYTNQGHFGGEGESDKREFPELLEAIKSKLNMS